MSDTLEAANDYVGSIADIPVVELSNTEIFLLAMHDERNRLTVENAALRADKERLDWLDTRGLGRNPRSWSCRGYADTIRAAIDAIDAARALAGGAK